MELNWNFLPASQFGEVEDLWTELNRNAADSPILDWKFFDLLLSNFSSGEEIIAICRSNGLPLALTVMERMRLGVWQTLQRGQAPIGAWLQSPNVSVADLLSSFINQVPGLCVAVGVTQQDPDLMTRQSGDRLCVTSPYIETARVPVHGSFSDYWAGRGRNLRQNLKRQRNRLARENVSVQFKQVTQLSEIRAAIDQFGILESAGWKGAADSAVNPSNAQGRFYSSLFEYFAGRNEASVWQYFFEKELVATDLCLHRRGVLYVLKTAHDEERKGFSPAMLMRQDGFEQLFDGGSISRVEFYGRVMAWHRKLTDDIRTMYHVTAYRSSLIAALADLLGRR